MAHTALLIERLLQFSLQHSLIGELDAYVARNTLLDLFGLSEPWADGVPEEHLDVPTVLLDALLDDAAARGLYDGEVPALRVNFEARSMGALNVQVILEPLGGGGHLMMAGAQLQNCTLQDAERRIREQIDLYRAAQKENTAR